VVAPVSVVQIPAIREALAELGYDVGDDREQIDAGALRQFQRGHGLTADGIIGRATASTLQRVLNARAKAKAPAAVAALGAAEAVPSDGLDALAGIPFAGEAAIVLAALRAAWLAFGYRDTLAPALDPHLPRLAAFLRSF
jgi:lysozyme